jgi:hypothetical protein
MIFYFATVLFIICTILTLTSVREEPLISSSSLRDDDEQPEIELDEKRPLLSLPRNSSRSYNSSNKPIRSAPKMYFSDLNEQEGFVEIDPATGGHIPHDYVERTGQNILLKTFETSHQTVTARISNLDSSNPIPVQTEAFEAELKQKAKLVKLGIQSFLTSSLHFVFFIIKVLCDVLHLKTVMKKIM